MSSSISVDAEDLPAYLYMKWREISQYLASQGQKLTLQCSRQTFQDHLASDVLIAGPWAWDINETVPYGDVLLKAALATDYNEIGRQIATVNVSSGVIIH